MPATSHIYNSNLAARLRRAESEAEYWEQRYSRYHLEHRQNAQPNEDSGVQIPDSDTSMATNDEFSLN